MLYRLLPLCLAAGGLLITPPALAADEPPGWEIGTSSSASASTAAIPPPPPPPAAPEKSEPTTFVMESSSLGEAKTRMTSPVLFGIGATLAGMGLISAIAGYAVYKDAPDCNDCPGSEKHGLGAGFIIGGSLGVLIGLPLAFIGARQVPDSPSWAKALPEVYLAPRGGTLRWTF